MKENLKNFNDIVEKIETVAGLFCLGALFLSTTIGVFSRYVLNIPLGWPEEISTGLMIWAIFLGTAIVFNKKEHILLSYFLKFLPPKIRGLDAIIVLSLIEFFLIILIWKAIVLSQTQIRIPWGCLEIPGAFYFTIPAITSAISMFMSNTYFIWDEICNLLEKSRKKTYG